MLWSRTFLFLCTFLLKVMNIVVKVLSENADFNAKFEILFIAPALFRANQNIYL